MQFVMKQAEIEVAVRQYVASMGISAQIDEVSLSATRGPDGITATIEIGSLGVKQASTVIAAPAIAAAVAASPVEVAEVVEAAPVTNLFGAPVVSESVIDIPEGKTLFGGG